MAGDAFEETLAGFSRWAGTTERKLSGDPAEDAAELHSVFGLMPDYLGIDAPSGLTAGGLSDLLLHVYPRKVTVVDPKDLASTIPALRDLTSYLADTGAITAATARAMDRELDEIEPRFAGAVMDPANWGPATATMHAMLSDGVDISDSASVDRWIAQQNAGALTARAADPLTWDGVDLKAVYDIPGVVAPVRLPGGEALMALAAAAPMLADRTDGAAALDAWGHAFAQVLDTTLEAADQAAPQAGGGLDLTGLGIALVMELFLGARAGVPVAELSESLMSAAVDEVPPDEAERHWEEWTSAHGDPAVLLLGQLEKLSAVTVADGKARLEPLALHSVAAKLRAGGVHVPDLPPVAEMTPDDVVLLSMLGTEEDFAADFAAWVANRTPGDAARELLSFAAGEGPVTRPTAVRVASRLGDAAEPALWDALDRPELRCYARVALITQLAERDPEQPVPAELRNTTEDLAWFVTDSFAPLTPIVAGDATFPFDMVGLSDAAGGVGAEQVFDAMARLDHPDAEAVLTMLGKHCYDKKTAKAARKAAFKAASHRASRRS